MLCQKQYSETFVCPHFVFDDRGGWYRERKTGGEGRKVTAYWGRHLVSWAGCASAHKHLLVPVVPLEPRSTSFSLYLPCDGLVLVSPLWISCRSPRPHCDNVWRRALVISSVLSQEERLESMLSLSAAWRHSEKSAVGKPRCKLWPEPNCAGPDLKLPASRPMKNNCLV